MNNEEKLAFLKEIQKLQDESLIRLVDDLENMQKKVCSVCPNRGKCEVEAGHPEGFARVKQLKGTLLLVATISTLSNVNNELVLQQKLYQKYVEPKKESGEKSTKIEIE